ncbi:unnamed protein product [Blepharisma stoltei]|uniref:hydroxymethylglutaryl-CoA lyase n=1 Tax=Blepharisma stoltei TaxID=1481888 RepID=A0AAU9K690_9CILI|nr:unnamed protein product [Blepharisma stoltei]
MRSLREIITQYRGRRFPSFVTIKEMGPRDGLQNEKSVVSTDTKVQFINRLSQCGYKSIEVTSFVSPKAVPQMADNYQVFQQIQKFEGISYPVLTPNMKGYDAAIQAGAKEVAVFTGASETFCQKNINCSIEESIRRFLPIMEKANDNNVQVRGYVSCVMGCPFEGDIDPAAVRQVAKRLNEIGCYEISLGDTIGIGTPEKTIAMLHEVLQEVPLEKLALHCHNTYGRAIQNILTGLEMGVSIVDSSIASLGGCPYAPGATGNVSTEDVVYVLSQLGVETGLDLQKLEETANWICAAIGRENRSLYRGSE